MTTFGIKKRVISSKKLRYYCCITCKEKFLKPSLLNKHYSDQHPPLLCTVCDKEFVMPNGLEWHSYLHKTLKFKCTFCEAMFPFQSSMDSHMLTHSMEKKHTCSHKGCDKSFYSKGDLTKHANVHLNTTWKCSQCDYMSNDERNLKAHHRKHMSQDQTFLHLVGLPYRSCRPMQWLPTLTCVASALYGTRCPWL